MHLHKVFVMTFVTELYCLTVYYIIFVYNKHKYLKNKRTFITECNSLTHSLMELSPS
jgi:hypothetical protein